MVVGLTVILADDCPPFAQTKVPPTGEPTAVKVADDPEQIVTGSIDIVGKGLIVTGVETEQPLLEV